MQSNRFPIQRHEVLDRGRRVVWRSAGQGPHLVLLHGGHGDWRHWIRNIDALAPSHTLWLPDMPGFGESDEVEGAPDDPHRMERLLDALVATLGTLLGAATPVDLAGFSFGGLAAARLALRRPVRRLALVGAGGHGGPRRQHTALIDWRRLHGAERTAAFRNNLIAHMLHDAASMDESTLAVYAAQCEAARFRAKQIALAGGLQASLAAFQGPLLLVWGEHDVTATPRELLPQLAAGRSHCEWHVVQGAGHWVQYERAAEVSARLLEWFARK